MRFCDALDQHDTRGIDHSRQSLFLHSPWARSCIACWQLVTFTKAKLSSQTPLDWPNLIVHTDWWCKYFSKPEMVLSYLARDSYCISQLLSFLSGCWASEIGKRDCFPIELKSWCVYQRMNGPSFFAFFRRKFCILQPEY